jgi:UDP-3-O-[3-hydroxymyristoyl] glucosamine N-acyltransferase
VFIGDEVYLENEYPEAVVIGSGAEVGLRSVLIAHFRGPGRLVIGKDAWIGACSVIASASGRTLTIGDGAVIGAGSVVPPTSQQSSNQTTSARAGKDSALGVAQVAVLRSVLPWVTTCPRRGSSA